MASPAEPDHTSSGDDVSRPESEQEDAPGPAEAGQSAERTQEAGPRQSMEPEGQHRAEAEAASTPGLDVELDANSQAQALASLKDLCDSGLLPMNLYQENVAAIHRSSRRLQQWRERLHEKSQQLRERHAAMKVRQSCLNPSMSRSAAVVCCRPPTFSAMPSVRRSTRMGCLLPWTVCTRLPIA